MFLSVARGKLWSWMVRRVPFCLLEIVAWASRQGLGGVREVILWIQWCHREARAATKGGPRRCLSLYWIGIVSSTGAIVVTKDISWDDVERQGIFAGQIAKNNEGVWREEFAACCCCLSTYLCEVVQWLLMWM